MVSPKKEMIVTFTLAGIMNFGQNYDLILAKFQLTYTNNTYWQICFIIQICLNFVIQYMQKNAIDAILILARLNILKYI